MRVAVIGAGIAGITAAYYIMKKGHEVTVYEKERYAGMKCSYANGGQISVSNSEGWGFGDWGSGVWGEGNVYDVAVDETATGSDATSLFIEFGSANPFHKK